MSAKKDKQYWKIQGLDGTNLLFERKILCGQITEKSMKEILRTLVAKVSLSEDEIISSYAKKRTTIYANHLDVSRSRGGPYMLTYGNNPYVIATVENGL